MASLVSATLVGTVASTSFSIAHTASAGGLEVFICVAERGTTGTSPSALTYGGVDVLTLGTPVTLLTQTPSGQRVHRWYHLPRALHPGSGSRTVTCTWAGVDNIAIAVIEVSATGVVTIPSSNQSSTNATVPITAGSGDLTIGCAQGNSATPAFAPVNGQTEYLESVWFASSGHVVGVQTGVQTAASWTGAGSICASAFVVHEEASGGDDTTADIAGVLLALEGSVSAALAIDATIAGSTLALVGDVAVSLSIGASAAGILSGLTGDAAADLAIEASLAGSTLALVGDVSTELALSGAIDGNLPGLTGAVAAELALGASVAGQLPGLVGDVSVAVSIEAAIAATLPLLSGAFAGVAAATVEGVLPGLVGQVAAELAISGAVASSLPGLAGDVSARVGIAGTAAGALPGLTADASAGLHVAATVQATLPALQGAFDAEVNGDTEATMGGVLPMLAAAAVAALAIQVSVDAGLPLLVGAFSEAVEVPVDPIPRLTATWTPGVRLSATHTPGIRLTATWSSSQ